MRATILTERDVRAHPRGQTLYAGPGARLTPLATETATLLGVKIVFAAPPLALGVTPCTKPAMLCINLPDTDEATYRIKVSGGKVLLYEQAGGQSHLLSCTPKRQCTHPHKES